MNFEKKYIPSGDLRKVISERNWSFSDREKAAIIWNSAELLETKHEDIKNIGDKTADLILKQQIQERLSYDKAALEKFENRSEGFIYATNTDEFSGEDNIIGYFKTHKLAYEAGKRSGYSFKIEKHQIIDEDTVVIKSWSINSPLIEPDVEKQIEEIPYEGGSVAAIEYNKEGMITYYWSCEISKEEAIKVETLSRERFENAYVVYPNPYEIGESVRVLGTDKIGRVGISQEDWEWNLNKALMDNAIEDYSDASIMILYDDKGYDHGHISPIFLERVKR